jgi:two-component sensor histidine kinase
MKNWLPVLFTVSILLGAHWSIAQSKAIDSLNSIIKNANGNDKTIAQIELINHFAKSRDFDTTLHLAFKIKKAVQLLPNEQKGKYLHLLGIAHFNLRDFDSSRYYFELSQNELLETKNVTHGSNLVNLGAIAFYKSEYDSAISLFDEAIELFYEIGDTSNAIKSAMNRSIAFGRQQKPIEQIKGLKSIAHRMPKDDWKATMILYSSLGGAFGNASLNDSAAHYFFKALKIAQTQKDSASQSIYLGNLSQVYSNLELNKKALFYSVKALKLNKAISRTKGIAYSLFALARVKKNAGELDSALHYYFKCLTQLKKVEDDLYGVIYNNLGSIHLTLQNLDSANYYLALAVNDHKDRKSYNKLGSVYPLLAEISLLQKKPNEAANYLDSAKKYAYKFGSYQHMADYHGARLLYNANQGDFIKSKNALDNYAAYKDSILDEENSQYALNISQLFEDEARKAAIKDLKQKQIISGLKLNQANLRSRNLIISLSLAFLLAIIIAWALVNKRKSYKTLQQANTKVEKQNAQLEVLNKEIYHRAKNNLQTISSLLGLQQFDLTDEKAKEVIADNQNRINTMAFINKRLFSDNRIQKVDFVDFVKELIEELSYVFDIDNGVTHFTCNSKSLYFEDKEAIALGLITNELLTNAYKYGLSDLNPKVELKLNKTDNQVCFTIHDNGNGFDEKSLKNTFGEEMIEMMAEQLEAKVVKSNDNGAKVEVTFNLSN